jgi:hypothetical protein
MLVAYSTRPGQNGDDKKTSWSLPKERNEMKRQTEIKNAHKTRATSQ